MKTLAVALAATGLLVAPSMAMAGEREQVAVRVATADLDLSNPADVAQLRSRMNQAIAAVCNPGDRLNADMKPDWQCRQEMGANGEAKVAALVGGRLNAVASN